MSTALRIYLMIMALATWGVIAYGAVNALGLS
jgi:hypothetical protein